MPDHHPALGSPEIGPGPSILQRCVESPVGDPRRGGLSTVAGLAVHPSSCSLPPHSSPVFASMENLTDAMSISFRRISIESLLNPDTIPRYPGGDPLSASRTISYGEEPATSAGLRERGKRSDVCDGTRPGGWSVSDGVRVRVGIAARPPATINTTREAEAQRDIHTQSTPEQPSPRRARRVLKGECPKDAARRRYTCEVANCSAKFARPSALKVSL